MPAQAETIELVISTEADKLERFAASELERYLEELSPVSVTIVSSPSPTAAGFVLLGTSRWKPQTYPKTITGV
jgi:hypothetical protein